jgi:hypothetical protein
MGTSIISPALCDDCIALTRHLRLHLEPHAYLVQISSRRGRRQYRCLLCMATLSSEGKRPDLVWKLIRKSEPVPESLGPRLQ